MPETVRVSAATHTTLQQLAQRQARPITQVLTDAVEAYRRAQFWAEYQQEIASLLTDPDGRTADEAEARLWEATLMDGLDPEEVWTDADYLAPAPAAAGAENRKDASTG